MRDYHESIGRSEKAIAVDQITAQVRQEESEAAYLRGVVGAVLGRPRRRRRRSQGGGPGAFHPSGGPGSPNIGAMLATVAGF